MLRVAGRGMFQGRSSQSQSIERPPMRVRTSCRYALGSISLGLRLRTSVCQKLTCPTSNAQKLVLLLCVVG